MPVAAIAPIAGGLLAGGGAASGGKKMSGAAKQAAQQQFQMQQTLFNNALSAWTPAANYFKSLLSGDPTQIAAAVGPTSDILKQQGQATSQQLATSMPAGGEANLAQTQNSMNTYNQMARLYAGVQPQAAQALAQMAQLPGQTGAPNIGSGLKFDTHQQEMLGQSKGSLGTGLGQLIGSRSSSKGSGGKNTGSAIPANDPSICWIAQVIYGEHDPRVALVRGYLLGRFSRHLLGRFVVGIYKRYGQRLSRKPMVLMLLKPLFDRIVRTR